MATNLSATAKVILGMLRMRPRSGYEIKSFVDTSTSFFWSAAYGSIYPELKRLREAGLIAGTDEPTGDRRRVVYELTDAGHAELEAWMESEPETMELRDEPLLQLFFARDADEAAAALRAKANRHAEFLGRLEPIRPLAASLTAGTPALALEFGIAFHEFARGWCERKAAEVESGRATAGGGS